MLWGRDGAHKILQIRATKYSGSWDTDWLKLETIMYRKAG